ncbi:MAG: SGNH/GDSL hydrolase family protein [Aphanothece saxicola GSE-SYN-MK-01-06B]|jgi:hypothetical protein|nr:SGNH/GDSL hydrolase family protein [Aphanothece saxicola GSE-SYN-MK-01-06B]
MFISSNLSESQDDNIHIIGFSITGYGDQNSFGKSLERCLALRGWNGTVRDISYGGLTLDGLAGMVAHASANVKHGELVILEIATSHFSLHGRTQDEAFKYIASVVKYLTCIRKARIAFLNLFRQDLDDLDSVVLAIREISSKYNLPVLDLKARFRDSGVFNADDGIHPDHSTCTHIGELVANFLLSTNFDNAMHIDECTPSFEFYNLSTVASGQDGYRYEGRGKYLDTIILLAGQSIPVSFKKKTKLCGLYFLFGPETGFIEITPNIGAPIELITYDENSYYRRVGFRPIDIDAEDVVIVALPKTRDVQLRRSSNLSTASRRDFVAGFLVQSGD